MRRTAPHAIGAMSRALDEFYVDGIQHNIPFLAAIMENERWQSGKLSTGFIAEEFPQGFHGNELDRRLSADAAAVAVTADHSDNRRKRRIGGQMNGKAVKFSAERVVRLGDEWMPRRRSRRSTPRSVTLDRWQAMVRAQRLDAGRADVAGEIDGGPVTVQMRRIVNGYRLSHKGVTRRCACLHRARGGACAADAGERGRRHVEEAALPDARPRRLDRGR